MTFDYVTVTIAAQEILRFGRLCGVTSKAYKKNLARATIVRAISVLSALVGEVIAVAPGLGMVLQWLQSWAGLVCVVYIPAAGVAVFELRRMEKAFKRFRLYRAQTAASGMIKV